MSSQIIKAQILLVCRDYDSCADVCGNLLFHEPPVSNPRCVRALSRVFWSLARFRPRLPLSQIDRLWSSILDARERDEHAQLSVAKVWAGEAVLHSQWVSAAKV